MQLLSSSSPLIHHKSKKTSDGTLLEGKILYRQYQEGYRTALEPILMAASVPAKSGQTVIEGGCGAGAGLMCLHHRIPHIAGIGFEQHPEMIALANENFQLNQMNSLKAIEITLPKLPKRPFDFLPAGQEHVDHVFSNPPWHAYNSCPSPDSKKDLAKRLPKGFLAEWIYALSRPLRQGGTLTLALSASLYAQGCAIMDECKLGSLTLFPLWPKQNRPPRIILLQGRMGSTGGSHIAPGLILHKENGDFTTEANHILRDGKTLSLLP